MYISHSDVAAAQYTFFVPEEEGKDQPKSREDSADLNILTYMHTRHLLIEDVCDSVPRTQFMCITSA